MSANQPRQGPSTSKRDAPTASYILPGPSTSKRPKNSPVPTANATDQLPEGQHHTSGLRNTLHGNVYQLKLLLLFMKRAHERDYVFKLATEMTTAEKFDDVFLKYRSSVPGQDRTPQYVFLQAKHKQDETKNVTATDLLNESDGEFSLQKYFTSYRRITSNPKYANATDFILCTNINIAPDLEACFQNLPVQGDILAVVHSTGRRLQFLPNNFEKRDELLTALRKSSDAALLARKLAEHILHGKQINFREPMFKKYQKALISKVFEVASQNTIKIQDSSTGSFHNIFQAEMRGKNLSDLTLTVAQFSKGFLSPTSNFESESELPNELITVDEINDFFGKLTFALNGPNEVELGKCIGRELGEEFNLVDSDFVYSFIQKEILNWMKAKTGLFMNENHAQWFFDEVKYKIARLVAIGPTSLHRGRVKEAQLVFNDGAVAQLTNFLVASTQARVFHLIVTETLLGAVKVDQVLDQLAREHGLYREEDSHIFTNSRDFLMLPRLAEAFRGERVDLLVIECAPGAPATVPNVLLPIAVQQGSLKKIVLISDGKFDVRQLVSAPQHLVEEACDLNIKFTDCTLETQMRLRSDGRMKFQGEVVSLEFMMDGVELVHRETLQSLIDGTMLMRLISKEGKVQIGKPLEPLENCVEYIDRSVKIGKTISQRLERDTKLFLTTRSTAIENPREGQDIVIVSPSEHKYVALCNRYEGVNVHWLTEVGWSSSVWQWQRSSGHSLANLRLYVTNAVEFQEEALISEGVAVIAAEAGMGKSMLLSQLALKLKERCPGIWVIRIDLIDCSTELHNFQTDTTATVNERRVFNFLCKVGLNQTAPCVLEIELLGHFLGAGRVALLLDGFDEISPNYKVTVISMLKVLSSRCNLGRLWITTRPYSHLNEELEDALSTFSFTLNPFSIPDQRRFLKVNWGINSQPSQGIDTQIDELLNRLSQYMNDERKSFAEVPLHARMIATIFHDAFTTAGYESSGGQQLFTDQFNIATLYSRFFEIKFHEVYMRKDKGADKTRHSIIQMEMNQKELNQCMKEHKILALVALYERTVVEGLTSERKMRKVFVGQNSLRERVRQGRVKVGLVIRFGHIPIFVHRTYAEYFFAVWLTENHDNTHVRSFIREHIYGHTPNPMIRRFFEYLFASSAVHNAVLSNDVARLMELMETGVPLDTLDKVGRSALNLAAGHGHIEIVRILVRNYAESLNTHDKFFGWSPLAYADNGHHWDVADVILHAGGVINHMHWALSKGNEPNERGQTLLHTAAKQGYLDLFKGLRRAGVGSLNDRDNEGRNVLHLAAAAGRVEMVQHLLAVEQMDPRIGDTKGQIPLHLAAEHGRNPIVKYFVDDWGISVTDKSFDGLTALPLAASNGHLETVQYLVGKGSDVHAVNSGWEAGWLTPLHNAASSGHLDIVRYLMESGADFWTVDDDTPMHWAALSGRLQVVQYFAQEKEIDLEHRQYDGSTVLHLAAINNHLKLVEWLVSVKGAMMLDRDRDGKTPLHKAAGSGKLETVEFLSKHMSYGGTSLLDHAGNTPLHLAAGAFIDVVRFLCDLNALQLYARNHKGEIPLQMAAKSESDPADIVKYMIEERGVQFDTEDGLGRTAIDLSARYGSIHILNYLLDNIEVARLSPILFRESAPTPLQYAVLNEHPEAALALRSAMMDADSEKMSQLLPFIGSVDLGNLDYFSFASLLLQSLHFIREDMGLIKEAVRGNKAETVAIVLERLKCYIDVVDEKGHTPLMYATVKGKSAAVEVLLNYSPNVLVKDREGKSALHLAASGGHTVTVELLLNQTGLDINDRDRKGRTPLLLAGEEREWDTVTFLIEKGANVNAMNGERATVLHKAAGDGNLDMVKFIIDHGADLALSDNNGNTPLHEAAHGGEVETMKYLVEVKGADISCKNKAGLTPSDLAVQEGKLRAIAYLMGQLNISKE